MAEGVNLLLVRPSYDELLVALEAATQAAGVLGRRQRLTSAFWHARIAEVMARAEGLRQWEHQRRRRIAAVFVLLAWWVDHRGDRHVRICGGMTDRDGARHYSRIPEDSRPPLWHVYPDVMFYRSRAGQSEWVAACSCGVSGPPRALAWMGPCCGPCHDRHEEAVVPFKDEGPTMRNFVPGPIYALAYAPDGSALAVSHSFLRLTHCDLTNLVSLHLIEEAGHDEIRSLAFSPDGQTLAMADRHSGSVSLIDVATGMEHRLLPDYRGGPAERVAFSPDGRTLAALGEAEAIMIWATTTWEVQWTTERATAMGYAPDGRTIAVAHEGEVRLVTTDNWRERGHFANAGPPRKVHFLDFTPDGHHLVLLTALAPLDDFAPPPPEGRIELWDVASRQERIELRANVPLPSIAALSPDGRYLAWVVHDQHHSPSSITFWDVFAAREKAELEWDAQDMLYDLTFSPDGQTLATGGASGTVKLWPWRQLLELG